MTVESAYVVAYRDTLAIALDIVARIGRDVALDPVTAGDVERMRAAGVTLRAALATISEPAPAVRDRVILGDLWPPVYAYVDSLLENDWKARSIDGPERMERREALRQWQARTDTISMPLAVHIRDRLKARAEGPLPQEWPVVYQRWLAILSAQA